jgi:hypothetical protein
MYEALRPQELVLLVECMRANQDCRLPCLEYFAIETYAAAFRLEVMAGWHCAVGCAHLLLRRASLQRDLGTSHGGQVGT